MAISGITFEGQTPTANAMRAAEASVLTDGCLRGVTVSLSGNIVTIGAGYIVVAGAIIQISGEEKVTVSGTTGHFARIKAKIDTSKPSTPSDFSQVTFEFDTAPSLAGFPVLRQDNINSGINKIYEAEICVVKIGSSGIVRKATAMPRIPYGDTLPPVGAKGEIFLLKV